MHVRTENHRQSLYAEVTSRVVAELEAGRLSGRRYSGINVLILWAAVVEGGYSSQRWLTFRQAQAAGGHVRKGEKGTIVCYADRFTPKGEEDRAREEDREARQVAFLKRFTLFNVDQCEGLPDELSAVPELAEERERIPHAEALIAATGADFRIGGDMAFYSPAGDIVQVPPQQAFGEPINWYRTALHELGHWTGHPSRLDRDQSAGFGSPDYAREELVAEMASAFTCAALSIRPTVRHADYVGAWLSVLREDERGRWALLFRDSLAAGYFGRGCGAPPCRCPLPAGQAYRADGAALVAVLALSRSTSPTLVSARLCSSASHH